MQCLAGYNPQPKTDGFYYDEAAGRHAVEFIEKYCVHIKGKLGKSPFILAPWQRFIVANLFGWKEQATNLRRYRKLTCQIPRKNGKSNLAAVLIAYLAFCEAEEGFEIYSAATSQQQASIVYELVSAMARYHPSLLSRCKPLDTTKRILFPKNNGIYRALAAEKKASWGLNSSALVIDELFAFDRTDAEFYHSITTSLLAREQPLIIQISTAGYDKTSIWWQECEHARKIVSGDITDDRTLPIIFEPSDKDDWNSPETWKKCNPNWGVSFNQQAFESEYQQAKENIGREAAFRQLYLCEWTEQQTKFISFDKWQGCPTRPKLETEPSPCYAGIDLAAGQRDLAAYVIIVPREDKSMEVIPHFWIPEDTVRGREERDKKPYGQWIRDGYLMTTPGNFVDIDAIRMFIESSAERFNLSSIAADRWNCLQLSVQLNQNGIPCHLANQTFAELSEATMLFEKLVIDGLLIHNNHPILDWHCKNLQVIRDAEGRIRPTRASEQRIDGVVALITAISRFLHATANAPQLICLTPVIDKGNANNTLSA